MILGRLGPAGHIALAHENPQRSEALADMLRACGHRVSLVPSGARAGPAVVKAGPDLLVGSLTFADPPLAALVRGARQALGVDLPVLVVAGGEDVDGLVEADDMIREPVDPGELDLRIGGLLRARFERRAVQRRLHDLLGLYRVPWAASLADGPDALYEHLSRHMAQAVKAEKGLVLLYDGERRQIVGQAPAFGLAPEQVARARWLVDGEARNRWNFRKNGPLISNNAQADTRLLPHLVRELDLQSVLMAPMLHGPRLRGLLLVGDRRPRVPFAEEDLALLVALAAQAVVAVENLQLHEELKRTHALLQEYDRTKSEFVAIVAHDFRKPLMAIRGFAELVLEEPDIPAEARSEFMRTVISETEQLALLADDTLLITQMETGQFAFHWSEIDIGPFILDAVPMGLSNHSVLMDIPAQFPKIVADPDRLRQVITNLTMNAVKYSPHGGSIVIRCRERGPQHVVVEVVDYGLGIPAAEMDRLFRKFSRVRSPDHLAISGTGLGLYITRLIVEGHGGHVWVESELGKGSTFGLVLPVDARAAQRQPRKLSEPRGVPRRTRAGS